MFGDGGLEKLRRDIPQPSKHRCGFIVMLPVLQSAKLALYQAMRERGLARQSGWLPYCLIQECSRDR